MYHPTRRRIASMIAARRSVRLRRLAATSAFALLSLATYKAAPAQAQLSEICYAIADNNPPAQGAGGGTNFQDTLASVDLDTGVVSRIADITRPDGSQIDDIEALTSRPDFDFLIAANANELGRVDPDTGVFESLGFIEGYEDFDAIVIDRSGNQDRLLGVSKRRPRDPQNEVVEVILALDDNLVATGIASQTTLSVVSGFPDGTNSIDGIAISDDGNVLAIANGGPNTPQRLVGLDINSGVLTDRSPFLTADGAEIPDVEDLSFDLFGRLFATTGSSRNPATTETGYVYNDPGTGPLSNATNEIDLTPSGAIDFEASACLRTGEIVTGDLLLVKRITAVTIGGEETRFDSFENQTGTQADTQLRQATNRAFPLGVIEAPTALQPGDEVEYTVYVFNPTEATFSNVILCDPIRRPSVLQRDSIQFSDPSDDLTTLDFDDTDGFERAPLAVADDACVAALDGGTQFLAGPPGPTGAEGTGGGVVTDEFDIGPSEISATRFTIEVGALQDGETLVDEISDN